MLNSIFQLCFHLQQSDFKHGERYLLRKLGHQTPIQMKLINEVLEYFKFVVAVHHEIDK